MDTHINAGDAAYSLYENSVIQAYTKQAYHVSGGKITPGTSTTKITVAVDAGEASINGANVTWANEEVELTDAGVGPNGADQNMPRVDVISIKQNGALSATTGEPAPLTPDTDMSGDPLTPAPFEHWEPAPDDGARVAGCVLGLVLVRPGWASAQDMSDSEIKQWKLGAQAKSFGGAIDYNAATDQLILGNAQTEVALGGNLDMQEHTIQNAHFIYYDSTETPLNIYDRNGPNPEEQVIGLGASRINLYRELDLNGNGLAGALDMNHNPINRLSGLTFENQPVDITFGGFNGQINIDYDGGGSTRRVWSFTKNEHITSEPIRFTGSTSGGFVDNGTLFVGSDGDLRFKDGSGTVHNLY